MVHAFLTCSDDSCPASFDAYGPLLEVSVLACDCGCALEPIGWPDVLPGGPGPSLGRLELEPIGV